MHPPLAATSTSVYMKAMEVRVETGRENPVGKRVGGILTVMTPSGGGGTLPLPYFSGSCQVPVARKGYSQRSYLPKANSCVTPARPCSGSEAHSQPCRYSWTPEVTGVDEGGRLDRLSSGQVGVATSSLFLRAESPLKKWQAVEKAFLSCAFCGVQENNDKVTLLPQWWLVGGLSIEPGTASQ